MATSRDRICEKIILVILALLFPPIVALIERGCGIELLLNIVLTIFGWLPGVLHALVLIYVPASTITVVVPPAAPVAVGATAVALPPTPAPAPVQAKPSPLPQPPMAAAGPTSASLTREASAA